MFIIRFIHLPTLHAQSFEVPFLQFYTNKGNS